MEIDITAFIANAEPSKFSASRAELGQDAGKITWNNAKREAADSPLLPDDALDEFRSWAKEFGAWDEDEIAAWSATECNALLIQFVSGDLRELQSLCEDDGTEDANHAYGIDWNHAAELSERGTIGGRIYRGDDGRVYFYMGS